VENDAAETTAAQRVGVLAIRGSSLRAAINVNAQLASDLDVQPHVPRDRGEGVTDGCSFQSDEWNQRRFKPNGEHERNRRCMCDDRLVPREAEQRADRTCHNGHEGPGRQDSKDAAAAAKL
jgi:hypothetical protein